MHPRERLPYSAAREQHSVVVGSIDMVKRDALEAQAEPASDKAEEKTRLPAVIPITKPLSDEKVSRWDDAVAAMNEQHALIESVGGKTVIAMGAIAD